MLIDWEEDWEELEGCEHDWYVTGKSYSYFRGDSLKVKHVRCRICSEVRNIEF